jgi:hypothetical protein
MAHTELCSFTETVRLGLCWLVATRQNLQVTKGAIASHPLSGCIWGPALVTVRSGLDSNEEPAWAQFEALWLTKPLHFRVAVRLPAHSRLASRARRPCCRSFLFFFWVWRGTRPRRRGSIWFHFISLVHVNQYGKETELSSYVSSITKWGLFTMKIGRFVVSCNIRECVFVSGIGLYSRCDAIFS